MWALSSYFLTFFSFTRGRGRAIGTSLVAWKFAQTRVHAIALVCVLVHCLCENNNNNNYSSRIAAKNQTAVALPTPTYTLLHTACRFPQCYTAHPCLVPSTVLPVFFCCCTSLVKAAEAEAAECSPRPRALSQQFGVLEELTTSTLPYVASNELTCSLNASALLHKNWFSR